MSDPLHDQPAAVGALRDVLAAATAYLGSIDQLPAKDRDADHAAGAFAGGLPETGIGTAAALSQLTELGPTAGTRSAGPRFFHFVTGGSTPAALAADWFASALDQNAGVWVSSPLGSQLEKVALGWLKDLFGLPAGWGAVMTTGATMANFTALAAARQWWGEQHGLDVASNGFAGAPRVPVFTSGFVHASAVKALGMLGIGYGSIVKLTKDTAGRLDLDALEWSLEALSGAPALVLATAGEVNAGGYDPIAAMAEIAHSHNSWLHVDGAFGLYARVSPHLEHLAQGVEEADSVITDGHKWLNVPYDAGFAFVREERLMHAVFGIGAPYLPEAVAGHPDYAMLGPEMSRRARGLAVWATLAAYGREGYRAMIERHVSLAKRLGDQVEASEDFELLEKPVINVVCFRHRPPGLPESDVDQLNRRLGQALLDDGRVYFGTTVYAGKVAFRPAISNWRTRAEDVDLILPVLRELAGTLATGSRTG